MMSLVSLSRANNSCRINRALLQQWYNTNMANPNTTRLINLLNWLETNATRPIRRVT